MAKKDSKIKLCTKDMLFRASTKALFETRLNRGLFTIPVIEENLIRYHNEVDSRLKDHDGEYDYEILYQAFTEAADFFRNEEELKTKSVKLVQGTIDCWKVYVNKLLDTIKEEVKAKVKG